MSVKKLNLICAAILGLSSAALMIAVCKLAQIYYEDGQLYKSFVRNPVIYAFILPAPVLSILTGIWFCSKGRYHEAVKWMYLLVSSAICAGMSKGGTVIFAVTVVILYGGACRFNEKRKAARDEV